MKPIDTDDTVLIISTEQRLTVLLHEDHDSGNEN